jgi:site-specific recombinase XerD
MIQPMSRWIQVFLEAQAAELDAATNTQLAYARDLQNFSGWLADKSRDFTTTTRDLIESYLIDCQAEGLAKSTRARRLSAIKQLFRFAFDEGWRDDNPAIQIKGPGRDQRLPKTLEIAEVDRLLEAARTTPKEALRNACLMELLYATGMRVTELVSLPVSAARGDPRMLLVRGRKGQDRRSKPRQRQTTLEIFVSVPWQAGPPDTAPLFRTDQGIRSCWRSVPCKSHSAHVTARFCDPFACRRCRFAVDPDNARARRCGHNRDLHPCP